MAAEYADVRCQFNELSSAFFSGFRGLSPLTPSTFLELHLDGR